VMEVGRLRNAEQTALLKFQERRCRVDPSGIVTELRHKLPSAKEVGAYTVLKC